MISHAYFVLWVSISWNSFSKSSLDKIPSLKNALNSSKERAPSSTFKYKKKHVKLGLERVKVLFKED